MTYTTAIARPHEGTRFVWLEAEEGMPEMAYHVTRVLHEHPLQLFVVEYELPAVEHVPAVFREKYGAQFGEAKREQCWVGYGPQGWRRIDPPEGERTADAY